MWQHKEIFRDAVWDAAHQLAEDHPAHVDPRWDVVMDYIRCIEIAVLGETFYGTKKDVSEVTHQ